MDFSKALLLYVPIEWYPAHTPGCMAVQREIIWTNHQQTRRTSSIEKPAEPIISSLYPPPHIQVCCVDLLYIHLHGDHQVLLEIIVFYYFVLLTTSSLCDARVSLCVLCSFTESGVVTSSFCVDGEYPRGIYFKVTIFAPGEECEESYFVTYMITELRLVCSRIPLGEYVVRALFIFSFAMHLSIYLHIHTSVV